VGLNRYETEVKGTRTTLLFSDEDAIAAGLLEDPKAKAAREASTSKAKQPANKAATPANK